MDDLTGFPYWEMKSQLLSKEAPKKGYIYLIWSSDRMYKIGRTTNLDRRMTQLTGQCKPSILTLLYAYEVEDQYEDENYLHRKFDDKRLFREWFDLDKKDLWRFAVHAQVREMQTKVLGKYLRDEEIIDDDCLLRPVYIETPHGQICGKAGAGPHVRI